MRKIIVIFLAQVITGCMGVSVGTFGTFEIKQENISLTKEQLISRNGVPDDISTTGNCEVLTYFDGYSWSGIGAFVVIIPVPLLVPSGYDETRYYFINGKSVASVSEYGEITGALGFMCGSNECEALAGPVNTDKTREVKVTWCS